MALEFFFKPTNHFSLLNTIKDIMVFTKLNQSVLISNLCTSMYD